MKNENITEKEWYRQKIIKMVKEIHNERFIKMIYGFTGTLWNKDKAGQ